MSIVLSDVCVFFDYTWNSKNDFLTQLFFTILAMISQCLYIVMVTVNKLKTNFSLSLSLSLWIYIYIYIYMCVCVCVCVCMCGTDKSQIVN